MKALLAAVGTLLLMSCETVTIVNKGMRKAEGPPSYQKSYPYFIFGSVGEHHIDVKNICGGKDPVQMRAQTRFLDGFLGVVTIGIYTPRTARIWCSSENRGDES